MAKQLSKYFTLDQLTVTDMKAKNVPTGSNLQNLTEFSKILDTVKDKIGNYKVISGYRSPEVTAALIKVNKQAVAKSLHEIGKAADIQPMNMTAPQFLTKIFQLPDIKNKLGEIAVKTNVLHLSSVVPGKKSNFMYVNKAGQYIKFAANELDTYVKQHGVATAISGGAVM